jgi:hypothetical protein
MGIKNNNAIVAGESRKSFGEIRSVMGGDKINGFRCGGNGVGDVVNGIEIVM